MKGRKNRGAAGGGRESVWDSDGWHPTCDPLIIIGSRILQRLGPDVKEALDVGTVALMGEASPGAFKHAPCACHSELGRFSSHCVNFVQPGGAAQGRHSLLWVGQPYIGLEGLAENLGIEFQHRLQVLP